MCGCLQALALVNNFNMQPKLDFVAIGVNRDSNALDWESKNLDLIAYGAGKFVAIYDTAAACVLATLRGHKGTVNAVKWLSSEGLREDACIVSLNCGVCMHAQVDMRRSYQVVLIKR